jgi:dienelactone hydrolase
MKRFPGCLLLFIFFINSLAIAQKQPLNLEADLTWPSISYQRISNDGRYVCYLMGNIKDGNTLIIKSTETDWTKELGKGTSVGTFSENNRLLLFGKGRDSIGILDIQKQTVDNITNISEYEIAPRENAKWLLYYLKSAEKELIIRDLSTGKEIKYDGITSYSCSPKGNVLLLEKEIQQKNVSVLSYLNLNTGKLSYVGSFSGSNRFIFDEEEKQLAFLTTSADPSTSMFRYYQLGMDSATVLVSSSSKGMNNMVIVDGRNAFSTKGDKFFFTIENRKPVNNKKDSLLVTDQVNVWSYKDDSLDFIHTNRSLLAVVHLQSKDTITKLTNHSDGYIWNYNTMNNGEYLLVTSNFYGSEAEYDHRSSAIPDLYMISTKDGSRKLIKHGHVGNVHQFSAGGKYAIWFDIYTRHWFTYNILTTEIKNISGSIPAEIYREDDQPIYARPLGIAGWLPKDKAVLIYSRNDIWKTDPDGINKPVCVTNYHGIKNSIQFKNIDFELKNDEHIVLPDRLLLTAFNTKTKENGFYSLSLKGTPALTRLIMSPHLYYRWWANPDFPSFQEPILLLKARNSDKYIVSISSAKSLTNLFVTNNFKDFTPITNLAPEHEYNWFNTELVTWNLPDGNLNEGILFKPENFDSTKKYPIIFYYYEQSANALNGFINPSLSNGVMNIPWYVSNGYLVFVPDIHFKIGHTGQSACDAVVSAAQYLSKYPWVNKNKMGLQGHSHGSFETNYIVSHSSLFTAACSNSGATDIISKYGKKTDRNDRKQWYYETTQGRIGASLWENPELYIENSAIFKADKVTTPLLIMHNKKDGSVPFDQGAEWFNHLSYLGKKVWLISYDGETHTIAERKNQLDFTIRMQQFFDHYLKDKPAPIWMTQGVPDSDKGIISGLQLDTSGQTP